MKNQFILATIILFIFSSAYTHAQDLIVKQNSDEIEAKILEIGTSEIKYKLYTYLDGPTFILNKSEIFYIKYSNGTKEIVTPLGNTPATIQNTPNPYGNIETNNNTRPFPDMNQPLDMMNQNGYIYQNGMFVSEASLMSALKLAGKKDVAEMFSLSKKYNFSKAFFGVGIPLMGIGLFGIIAQGINRSTADITEQLTVAGSITAFTGAALLTTGILIDTSQKRFKQKAMIAYNEGLNR